MNKQSASFSRKVKAELEKIRESGKEYKETLAYGISYGKKSASTERQRKTDAESLIIDRVFGGSAEIGGIFLRGVFISCGSISDPAKDYHLELVPPDENKCGELLEFLSARGLKMKQSERRISERQSTFLYCKECEQIADFLTYIGAVRHSMELMNVIILKEIRNNVNRAVNCESANIGKITRAAENRIRDIEYVLSVESKSKKAVLTRQLREVALIQRNNAEIPLSEIGEMLDPPISKSGVNHRLKKISVIAEELRKVQ